MRSFVAFTSMRIICGFDTVKGAKTRVRRTTTTTSKCNKLGKEYTHDHTRTPLLPLPSLQHVTSGFKYANLRLSYRGISLILIESN